MDVSAVPRSRVIYLEILSMMGCLEEANEAERVAMLLRIGDLAGELAELAERGEAPPSAGLERGTTERAREWTKCLVRLSVELIKVWSSADFYRHPSGVVRLHDAGSGTHTWRTHQARARFDGLLAA